MIAVQSLGVIYWALNNEVPLPKIQTLIFTLVVISLMFNAFNWRSERIFGLLPGNLYQQVPYLCRLEHCNPAACCNLRPDYADGFSDCSSLAFRLGNDHSAGFDHAYSHGDLRNIWKGKPTAEIKETGSAFKQTLFRLFRNAGLIRFC